MNLSKIIKTRDELLDNLAGAIECKDRVTERRYYRDAFEQYQNLITATVDLEVKNKALRAAMEVIVDWEEERRKMCSQDSGIVPQSYVHKVAAKALLTGKGVDNG